MKSVLVTYSFVVDVDDPDDEDEIIQAVRDYISMTRDPLESPDNVEVL